MTRGSAVVAPATIAGAFVALAAAFAPDLDVAVPSGAPLDWKSALPQRYVRSEPSFGLTRDRDEGRYATARPRVRVRSLGVVRPEEVLTLDFATHLGFAAPAIPHNPTGFAASERPYPPRPDVELYWRTTIALLQMLLHPQRVLRLEMMEQLTILGEGALAGLESGTSMGELADDAREVRDAIGRTPPRPPEPIAGRDPRATLLQQIVAQELCVARPYASDLLFGERLLLIRDDVLPAVLPYLESDHSLARRNAVALLAMLDAPTANEALVKVATTSDDAVARLRAIHALGARRERNAAPALRTALQANPDAVTMAALVRALGEIGDPESVPLLLTLDAPAGAKAELLIVRLMALVRLELGAKRDAVSSFVRPWLDVTGAQAAWLKKQDPKPPERPDQPDPSDLRTRTVEQLARLLDARLHPDDVERRRVAMKPFEEVPPERGRLDRFPCARFGDVAPLNRAIFVVGIAALGDVGVAKLREIADDATCEPELRLAAVEALPMPEKLDVAAAMARDVTLGLPLELAAFELLDLFNDARAVPAAEELGPATGLELRSPDDPVEHWRLLLTVQALGRRNRLSTPELVTVLKSADPRRVVHADPMRVRAEAFVDEALRIGRKSSELRELAKRLLQAIAPAAAGPRFGWEEYDADVATLIGLVEAALDHPNNAKVRAATVASIAGYLEIFVARRVPIGSTRGDAYVQVPLLETVLMELARKADDAALEALSDVTRDATHPSRAAACIALGATNRLNAAPLLLYLLKDDDPFVRVCAWLALEHVTGQRLFADWLNGDSRELDRGFQEWGGWVVRHAR